MRKMRFLHDRARGWAWGLTVWLAVAAMLAAPAPVFAHAEHGHPARIHEGSCAELGAVAYRLNGVGASVDLDNAPLATPTAVNPDSAYQVMVSETTIDAPLQEIVNGEHAVMLYESDEAMDAIACGNIGGAMSGDALISGLGEVGIPGHVGFAVFTPAGEQTSVSVIVGHAMTPVSAPGLTVDEDQAAEEEPTHDDDHEHAEEEGHDDLATPEA